jgi:hypothetical protein
LAVYDCFPFNNELDLLDFRITTYWEMVDFFVISESSYAFNGNRKPMHATEYVKRKYGETSKIIIVEYEPTHEILLELNKNRWPIENLARQTLAEGFKNASEEDLIILSDCDEFLSFEQIEKALKTKIILSGITPMFFRKGNFLVSHSARWQKVRMGPKMLMINLNEIRDTNYPPVRALEGMHLSYLETNDRDVLLKHSSSAHSEIDVDKRFLIEALRIGAQYGIDHLGRFETRNFGLIKILKKEDLNDFQRLFMVHSPKYFDFNGPKKNLLRRVSASRRLSLGWESMNLLELSKIDMLSKREVLLDCGFALNILIRKVTDRIIAKANLILKGRP